MQNLVELHSWQEIFLRQSHKINVLLFIWKPIFDKVNSSSFFLRCSHCWHLFSMENFVNLGKQRLQDCLCHTHALSLKKKNVVKCDCFCRTLSSKPLIRLWFSKCSTVTFVMLWSSTFYCNGCKAYGSVVTGTYKRHICKPPVFQDYTRFKRFIECIRWGAALILISRNKLARNPSGTGYTCGFILFRSCSNLFWCAEDII